MGRMGHCNVTDSNDPLVLYGFLQSQEVVVPSEAGFGSSQYLTYKDIAVDDKKELAFIVVNKKQLKTDPFRRGVTVIIDHVTGPIHFTCGYSPIYGKEEAREGPLFQFENGCLLTREHFVARVWKVLQQIKAQWA